MLASSEHQHWKCFFEDSNLLINLGQSIQEWTEQIFWKTAFKKIEGLWSALSRPYPFKFLKAVFHKFYLVYS